MAVLTIEHIVETPEIASGRPRIAGSRVRVMDVISYHRAGWSVERISEELGLTLGQIYAALSYYFDHQAEIDADLHEDEVFAKSVAEQYQAEKRRIQARMK